MSKKALGKGIDALLELGSNQDALTAGADKEVSIESLIPNPDQPRRSFNQETLQELADSIKEQGIIQPIIVERGQDEDSYCIIAGERRYRAAKLAGVRNVPVIVRSFSKEQKLEIALIENIQREDLNPVEEAQAYKHLMETLDLGQEEVAKRVGKKRSTVANSLRLLKLNDDMQKAIIEDRISAGHARAILSVVNPADQAILFSRIVNDGLSVRKAEEMALDLNRGQRGSGTEKEDKLPKKADPELQQIQQRLINALGTKVQLKGTTKKGQIEISYYSMDDLERVYELLLHK